MTHPDQPARLANLAGLATIGFQAARLALSRAQRDVQALEHELAALRERRQACRLDQDPVDAQVSARHRLWLVRKEARLAAQLDRARAETRRKMALAGKAFGRMRATEAVAQRSAQAARDLKERRAEAAHPPPRPASRHPRPGNLPLKTSG